MFCWSNKKEAKEETNAFLIGCILRRFASRTRKEAKEKTNAFVTTLFQDISL